MMVYAVPLEAGCEISISPLYSGLMRSAQHFGSGSFFFFSSSVLKPKPIALV